MNRLLNILGILGLALLALVVVLLLQGWVTGSLAPDPASLASSFNTFTTIFLGIFIEAAPFLLLGTLASGLVEVYLNKEAVQRMLPRNPFAGALAGGMLGFVFPVCECGVVPLTRRFFHKGMSPATGISFLLASPVLNPIVIASTAAAYGWGAMLWLRVGLSLVIAVSVGLLFALHQQPRTLLRPVSPAPISGASVDLPVLQSRPSGMARAGQALTIAADEFFEMGRYLIIGSLLAALMQTVVPQTALLALGSGPLLSVLVMIALAVLLSICSTVDAFVSLAFVGTFTTGSILGFLVFGPMVDIKSTFLYLQVFKRRTVLYMVLLPLLMTVLAAVFINLNVAL